MSRHGDEGHVCAPDFKPPMPQPYPEQFLRDVDENRRRAAKRAKELAAAEAQGEVK